MNNLFDGYFKIKEEELKRLVLEANIVFDTSSLFGLYRSKDSTSSQVLAYLEKSKKRVFLPFMVGLEYHDNRSNVLSQQRSVYTKINKKVEELESSIGDFFVREEHINVEYEKINSIVDNFSDKLKGYLKKAEQSHPNYLINDPIREQLVKIFSNNTGDKFTKAELDTLYEEGEQRFQSKIPPGYKDAKNKEHEIKRHGNTIIRCKYADFLIWKEILNFGFKNENDLLLIIDEKKPDWILEEQGYKIGPRPELVTEYFEHTGRKFHILDIRSFFELLQRYSADNISKNTVDDLKKSSTISWKDEVLDAVTSLGGTVTLEQLYEYIENNSSRAFTKNWRGTARKAIYYYCEDRDLFLGKDKLYRELDKATYQLLD